MSESERERDPNIGEIFMDLDPREWQRRIKVVGFRDDPKTPEDEGGLKFWPKVVRTFSWARRPKYRYVVISNPVNPGTIGRRGSLSPKTLAKRYKKVSR